MTGDRRSSSKPGQPRMIVRRRREAVGALRPKTIIHRERGVVEAARAAAGRGPKTRRFRIPLKVRLIAGSIAVVAVLIGSGAWTYESPFLRVGKVEVRGTGQVTPDTVIQVAGLVGKSMFTADLGHAQQAIAKLPLVSTVTIRRAWPRTVQVTITERQPWGTWRQGGVDYTIDREGVVLGLGPASADAPVITSSEPGSRVQGERVNYQAVDAAAEIYAQLPKALGTTATEVAFVAGKGVQVTTANGQTALLGDSSSIAYKLAVWAALAKAAVAQRIEYTTIDLRFGNRPVLQ